MFPDLAPPPKATSAELPRVRERATPANKRRRKAFVELRSDLEDAIFDLRTDLECLTDPESADEATRLVDALEDDLDRILDRFEGSVVR